MLISELMDKWLENHIKTCVTRDIKEGKNETVDELLSTLKKFMK